ncbi:chemotaxis protein CheB [Actinoplanes sp. GCM10030250]|uniref:chemotaxis protein CheB n=1 Tax=Actinoplanes sp. GCM10030250 TaxID=3273376 RepID=UPI003621838B
MSRRDVVVIGGSAGVHAALRKLLSRLPADLPAAVLVVTHLPPGARSTLAETLAKDSVLPVVTATDGERLRAGRVYVAVPDRHLVIGANDVLRLSTGPRENRARPAVDALFRAAARWCGPRVVGVVLSGSLDDGAAGLAAVAAHGGAALVQDPVEARFAGMPQAALVAVPSAVAAPAAELARLIALRAGQQVDDAEEPDEALIWETDMVADGRTDAGHPQRPAALGCPECGGGMYEVRTGAAVHYVCHVGHSWSPQAFIAASDDGIEEALWTAISAMEEKATVLRDQAARVGGIEYEAELERVRRSITVLRGQLVGESDHAAAS